LFLPQAQRQQALQPAQPLLLDRNLATPNQPNQLLK
jgi:hypothetical protein